MKAPHDLKETSFRFSAAAKIVYIGKSSIHKRTQKVPSSIHHPPPLPHLSILYVDVPKSLPTWSLFQRIVQTVLFYFGSVPPPPLFSQPSMFPSFLPTIPNNGMYSPLASHTPGSVHELLTGICTPNTLRLGLYHADCINAPPLYSGRPLLGQLPSLMTFL